MKVFVDVQPSLQATCCQIRNLVDEIKESNRKNFPPRHACFDYKQIGWATPEEGWVKGMGQLEWVVTKSHVGKFSEMRMIYELGRVPN